MSKTPIAILASALALAAAGCGGDDSSDEPAKAPAKTETTAKKASAPAAGVPSYAQVKALALKDPKVAKFCAGKTEDNKIGISEKGETYTRLICGGNREILDYVVGKAGFAENYKSAVRFSSYDLWKSGSDAYVKSSLSGPKTLAADIEESCGCGETAAGQYGR